MVAALEPERLGRGAVDRSSLTGIQANSNAGWIGFDFIDIPDHRLDVALTIARLEEGEDILAADRLENRLMGRDLPQILHDLIGAGGGAERGESDDCGGRCDLQEVASERVHCGSPLNTRSRPS